MEKRDDIEIAIGFLKSIETNDPKVDLEIAFVVERLETILDNEPDTAPQAPPEGHGSVAAKVPRLSGYWQH